MQRLALSLLCIFFIWRILLFIPLAFDDTFLSYRKGYGYTNIWKFTKPYSPVESIFLYPWANFDGVYYLNISGSGYTIDNAGFLPAFPLLIRVLATVFGFGEPYGAIQFFSAFLIVHIAFFASLFMLYKLLKFDYNHSISIKTIFFLLLFPTSFFFVSIYTESLFLLLSVLSFYFARKRQWLASGISAMLLSATRIVGIVMLPALLYEFYKQEKTYKTPRILPLLLTPLGLIGYAMFNLVRWGDALHFLRVHGTLNNSRSIDAIVLFPQTIFRYIKIISSVSPLVYEWWIALLELSMFFLVALLLFTGWKKRIRFSYLIFALFSFLIPVSSGTFTGLPRYVVVLFPIFVSLALINNKWIRFVYAAASATLLGLLLMLFSRGYFVS